MLMCPQQKTPHTCWCWTLPSSQAFSPSSRLDVNALQLEAAVDEVALERLKAEEAERESRAAEEPLPDPERIPIEAPRAPRRTTSDLSTGEWLSGSTALKLIENNACCSWKNIFLWELSARVSALASYVVNALGAVQVHTRYRDSECELLTSSLLDQV